MHRMAFKGQEARQRRVYANAILAAERAPVKNTAHWLDAGV
jgi:hypothetical protein